MTRRAKLLGSAVVPDAIDMALIASVLERLIASDPTISGATLFSPDGGVRFIDAELLRRGGTA